MYPLPVHIMLLLKITAGKRTSQQLLVQIERFIARYFRSLCRFRGLRILSRQL